MNKIKNFKRMLFVLILCLSAAVCGCGSKADSKSDGGEKEVTSAEQTEETSEAALSHSERMYLQAAKKTLRF